MAYFYSDEIQDLLDKSKYIEQAKKILDVIPYATAIYSPYGKADTDGNYPDYTVLYGNKAETEWFGMVSLDQYVGKHSGELFPTEEIRKASLEMANAVFRTSKPQQYLVAFNDGKTISYFGHFNAPIFDGTGKMWAVWAATLPMPDLIEIKATATS